MVESADFTRDAHGENINLTSVCDTDRSHNLLLAGIDAVFGRHCKGLLSSVQEVVSLNEIEHSRACSVESIDAGCVVTATRQYHYLVLTIKEEVGHARAFVEWSQDKRLLHVSEIPAAPLSLSFTVETRSENRRVIDPRHTLLARSLMTTSFND